MNVQITHKDLQRHAQQACDLLGRSDEIRLIRQYFEVWMRVRSALGQPIHLEFEQALEAKSADAALSVEPSSTVDMQSMRTSRNRLRRELRSFSPFIDRCRFPPMGISSADERKPDGLMTLIVAYSDSGVPVVAEDLEPPQRNAPQSPLGVLEFTAADSRHDFVKFKDDVILAGAKSFRQFDLVENESDAERIRLAITSFKRKVEFLQSRASEPTQSESDPNFDYTPKSLAEDLGVSSTTFARYADKAQVFRPKTGKPGYRFPRHDVLAIVRWASDNAGRHGRMKAKELLRRLKETPA